MKLYTEEQVRQSIAQGFDWCHQKHIPSDYMIDAFIKELTPIELPTDDDIDYKILKFAEWFKESDWKCFDNTERGNIYTNPLVTDDLLTIGKIYKIYLKEK